MKDQHTKIKGYRDLSQEEIDLMNEIKSKGEELQNLIDRIDIEAVKIREDSRWLSIGCTHLQQGLMALTRAVAKPTSF